MYSQAMFSKNRWNQSSNGKLFCQILETLNKMDEPISKLLYCPQVSEK